MDGAGDAVDDQDVAAGAPGGVVPFGLELIDDGAGRVDERDDVGPQCSCLAQGGEDAVFRPSQ